LAVVFWVASGLLIPSGTDLVASLLARLEPSLRFRFSLIALGRGDKNKMAARLRPAKKLLARDASHGQDAAISARGVAYRRRRKQ